MRRLFLVLVMVLTIASCGKRGTLPYPAGNQYPRTYPEAR
jgi:predicted small lipoprotein YifL